MKNDPKSTNGLALRIKISFLAIAEPPMPKKEKYHGSVMASPRPTVVNDRPVSEANNGTVHGHQWYQIECQHGKRY